jgi:hypothetical protein
MRGSEHFSDSELLLAPEAGLSARRMREYEPHLKECESCRARQQALEAAQCDFTAAHNSAHLEAAPLAEQRALLREHLAKTRGRRESRPVVLAVFAAVAGMLAVLALFVAQRQEPSVHVVSMPDRTLTPGLAIPVSTAEICAVTPSKNRMVPVTLRRRVFEEYGIPHAEPQAYEVDYLITPALGGVDDIRNLWPQSYSATMWNAKVKDALEDRLHDLVCEGQLDLATAQRDIAADWVGAYKKYFHTDRPRAIQ